MLFNHPKRVNWRISSKNVIEIYFALFFSCDAHILVCVVILFAQNYKSKVDKYKTIISRQECVDMIAMDFSNMNYHTHQSH